MPTTNRLRRGSDPAGPALFLRELRPSPIPAQERQEYPPLHPEKKPHDPATGAFWRFFTEDEQKMLLTHPAEELGLEIILLRSEIAEVLKAQQMEPAKTPEDTLSTLYNLSVAAHTIGSLLKYQSDYNKTHNKWDDLIAEAMHIARIRTGVYRHVAALGYTVPEGVLDIEPDLLPHPQSYSDSLKSNNV